MNTVLTLKSGIRLYITDTGVTMEVGNRPPEHGGRPQDEGILRALGREMVEFIRHPFTSNESTTPGSGSSEITAPGAQELPPAGSGINISSVLPDIIKRVLGKPDGNRPH
jgi:hypothetical protein